MPPGLHLLIAAQFTSALADNALLIVAIARLQQQGLPAWWAPLLKFSFTIAYVVLAPLVGPLADAGPKARLMMAMNALKVVGVVALLAGLNPLAAYGLIGVAAAAYAPAKYGLLTELVPPGQLVRANGWIEVSTVCAILFGALLGGALVSSIAAGWVQQVLPGVAALDLAAALLLGVYALAGLLNLGIPASSVRHRRQPGSPRALWRGFARAQRRLWRDAEGGMSMSVTTLFWGAAAVLQFALLQWAVDALGLSLGQGVGLQAVVAVGIIVGAALAGRWVPLRRAARVLPLGIAMGLAVPVVGWVTHWPWAVPLLLLVGTLGGALLVPLNALLQHRGQTLLSAGRSIGVQNANENLGVLLMLGLYAALVGLHIDVRALITGLGLTVATAMTVLTLRQRRRA